MQVLEAWADCAAMLMDLPESISSSPDFAQELGVSDMSSDELQEFITAAQCSSNRCQNVKPQPQGDGPVHRRNAGQCGVLLWTDQR